ncbi:MAG: hypothetical protein K6E10_04700, partial [Eubacterium sp.]|nr:hypothetical protein [Eubacterium sp.]
MNFLDKAEKKLYKYTIPRLYLVFVICTIIGYFIFYVIDKIIPNFYYNLLLIPYEVVVNGQVWRLFTWIFTIPYGGGLFTLLLLPINLYFYYYLGKNLEMFWGRFYYNLYVIGGALLTDILVLIGSFYYYYLSPSSEANRIDALSGGDPYYAANSITRFMYISIFLAFTVVGGDHMIYLYFVIPLKMKWLGYFDLILMAYYFITGGFFTKIIVFSSVANYFIYFFVTKKRDIPSMSQLKNQQKYNNALKKQKHSKRDAKKEIKRRRGKVDASYNPDGTIKFPGTSTIIPPGYGNPDGISIHKCAVCGRTEITNPELEFRFCSKCNGNYESSAPTSHSVRPTWCSM